LPIRQRVVVELEIWYYVDIRTKQEDKFGDFLLRESDKPILDAEKFTDYCKQYIQFAKKIEAKTQDQDSDAFPHEKTEEVGADETNTDETV